MNIIYMHTHDTGRYIEPYGYAVPTPNLMKFAKEGTLFRNAYCTGPTCSPSRSGLLTGMAPHTNGMIGLAHLGFQLNDYNNHIVHLLNNIGYETVLAGEQHLAFMDNIPKLGYKKILENKNSHDSQKSWERDEGVALSAAEYIRQKKDGSFFLSFGMFNTHRPFPANNGELNVEYVTPPFPIADTKQNRLDFSEYIMSARLMDKAAGIVLDAVKESGHDDDTMIIFTTDHGIDFPRMKCNLYDTGIGVSLIIKYPGYKSNGTAIDALVSQIDIFPTICELLGVEKPDRLQGKSLVPLLEESCDKINDQIYSEVTYHGSYEPMRCIRTERYKLIKYFDDYEGIVAPNIGDGYSKDFMAEHGWMEQKKEMVQLFDLYLDPVERVNLVDDNRYAEVLKDLSARLQEWMKDTNDPLLHGEVPLPEGAMANKKTSFSSVVMMEI
jgi:N-sulfoglucosamine sulfohydrolase